MRFSFLLLLVASPAVAPAQPWSCDFTALCQTGRACLATAHTIALRHEGETAILSQEGEETTLIAMDAHSFVSPTMLLSISADGITATLTTHEAPVRSYLGTCEVLR